MRIYIKRPAGRRRSYAIYTREEKRNTVIEAPELLAINENLRAGIVAPEAAEKAVREVVKIYEQKLGISKPPMVHNNDNERIMEEYWRREYGDRDLVDPKTARYELERAVRALGNLSLLAATREQITHALAQHKFPTNKQRRIIMKLRALLTFIGRTDVRLKLPRETLVRVDYLNEGDFLALMARLNDKFLVSLFRVLFYTGMRIGEAFGFDEHRIFEKQGYVLVDTQLDEENELRDPKWGSRRKAFVERKHFKYLHEWLKIRADFPYSRTNTSKKFSEAAGGKLTIHDLRHSYAIRLLSRGVSMAHVAQCLGNSETVCRKYYVGFELVDESVEHIRRVLRKRAG